MNKLGSFTQKHAGFLAISMVSAGLMSVPAYIFGSAILAYMTFVITAIQFMILLQQLEKM